MIPNEMIESISCSVLSVNNWSLERTWACIDQLREADLFEPGAVSKLSVEEIAKRLTSSGYDRGGLTVMMAARLKGVHGAIDAGSLDELPSAVSTKDRQLAVNLMTSVRGIGRKVAEHALLTLV